MGESRDAGPGLAGRDREVGEVPEVPTVTLAEIYASQGHLSQARTVYARLLERAPEDQRLRRRLLELDSACGAECSGAGSTGSVVELLEGLLAQIRKERKDVLR